MLISIYAFADDLKLLSADPVELQSALGVVEHWSDKWQLRIQPLKSEQINFSRRHNHTINTYSSHTINNTIIPHTDVVKDLGILVTNNFKWYNYVHKICSKSRNLTYLLLKSFKFNKPDIFVHVYKMYSNF